MTILDGGDALGLPVSPPAENLGYMGCDWPIDAGCLSDEWEGISDDIKSYASALAGNTLRALTGNRVGGCPITVRPCKQDCSGRWSNATAYSYGGYAWFQPHINDAGAWVNSCGCMRDCSCTTLCQVDLPGPVGAIYEVKVNGDVISPADYKLYDTSLTWIGSTECPWPTCQDLTKADTADNTFSVTYLNAYPVDGLGARAAALLAWEYAQSCQGNSCKLPAAVTAITRQGVSYDITPGAFPDGFTGIREVDAYIALWNPRGMRQQATVWTPNMPKVHH